MKFNKRILLVFSIFVIITLFSISVINASDVGNSGAGSFSSSSSSSYSSSGSSNSDGIFAILFFIPFPYNVIIIIAILVGSYYLKSSNDVSRTYKSVSSVQTTVKSEASLLELRQKDNNFSKYEFLTYAKLAVIGLEESIEAKDYESARLYSTKEYLNTFKQENMNEVFSGQDVMNVSFYKYENNIDGFDRLTVEVFSSEKRKSNNFRRTNYVNRFVFIRDTNATTNTEQTLNVVRCPSCGAPSKLTDGVCDYCDVDISSAKYNWLISERYKISEKDSIYYSMYLTGNLFLLDNEDIVVQGLKRYDPEFNLENFEKYVEQSFTAVQEAWENRDFSEIAKFESEQLFLTHSSQIEEYKQMKIIPHIDNQEIYDIHINRFELDGKNEYMTVYVDVSLSLYTTNENNDEIVSGSKKPKMNSYLLRYKRSSGVKSSSEFIDLHYCPSCGAGLELNEQTECIYCHSVIRNGNHSFVLDHYEGITKYKKPSRKTQIKLSQKANQKLDSK